MSLSLPCRMRWVVSARAGGAVILVPPRRYAPATPARHLGAHAATTPCGPAEPRGPPMTDATDATDATDPTDPTANGQPPSRLRRSPLDDRHRALGATMTAFGGWDMPLDYGR